MSFSSILECSLKIDEYFPKPSHHPKNQDVVIISTYEGSQKPGIYEYNLRFNTFNKIYAYQKAFKPYNQGQFIDSKNELLYIFYNGKLGIFDLDTKIMNTD
eukprot:429264_1